MFFTAIALTRALIGPHAPRSSNPRFLAPKRAGGKLEERGD
jgi:hypothetical protein